MELHSCHFFISLCFFCGCIVEELTFETDYKSFIIHFEVRLHHLEVLNPPIIRYGTSCCPSIFYAIKQNHRQCFDILRQLKPEHRRWESDKKVVAFAAFYGRFEMMEILVDDHRCFSGQFAIRWSAMAGHLTCLKYACQHDEPEGEAMAYAAAGGSVECIRYLHEDMNLAVDPKVFQWAGEGGSLNIFKYLINHPQSCINARCSKIADLKMTDEEWWECKDNGLPPYGEFIFVITSFFFSFLCFFLLLFDVMLTIFFFMFFFVEGHPKNGYRCPFEITQDTWLVVAGLAKLDIMKYLYTVGLPLKWGRDLYCRVGNNMPALPAPLAPALQELVDHGGVDEAKLSDETDAMAIQRYVRIVRVHERYLACLHYLEEIRCLQPFYACKTRFHGCNAFGQPACKSCKKWHSKAATVKKLLMDFAPLNDDCDDLIVQMACEDYVHTCPIDGNRKRSGTRLELLE